MRVWSLVSSGLRWKAVVAVDGGIRGVCPILDIGAAGEEKGTYGLANGSDSTFCGAVKLVNVGRRKVALYGRLVAQFEEPCRYEFAAVVRMDAFDGELGCACRAICIGDPAEI